jgi:hypothetical protein
MAAPLPIPATVDAPSTLPPRPGVTGLVLLTADPDPIAGFCAGPTELPPKPGVIAIEFVFATTLLETELLEAFPEPKPPTLVFELAAVFPVDAA